MEVETQSQPSEMSREAAATAAAVSYLQYDQLPDLSCYAPSLTAASELVAKYLPAQQVSTGGGDWKDQFAALDIMRSANKFYSKDF